jgi:hypothetical protein
MILLKRFLIVVLILLFCPWHAWGDEFRLVPSLGLKEEYTSNVLLVTQAEGVKKDFISIVSPGIEMVDRTERLDADLSAQLDRLDYSEHRDLSATNQAFNGKFAYRATPLFNISTGAGYSKNANPTLYTGSTGQGIQPGTIIQLGGDQTTSSNPPDTGQTNTDQTNTGQTDTGQTGQVVSASSTPIPVVSLSVKRFTASLSADYQFTEKTSAIGSYNYASDYYEEPAYHDISHDVKAGIVYDFGTYLPTVKGRLNVGYTSFYLPDSRTFSTSCTIGMSRDFDELWSMDVDGGIRRTWSEVFTIGYVQDTSTTLQAVQVREDNSGLGWVASVALNYRGERAQESLVYVRDLILAYGLNGVAERNGLTLSTQYRMTHEFSALFSTSYAVLKSDPSLNSGQAIDQRTFDINAGIRYEFTKDTAVDVSYDYTMVSYPGYEANAYRQFVFVSLRSQFPFWE